MTQEIQDLKDAAALIKESTTETIIPDQLHILRFELNKAESNAQKLTEAVQKLKEEMETKDRIIGSQEAQIDQMIVVQRQLVQENLPPTTQTRSVQTSIVGNSAEVQERNERIRHLEFELNSARQDNQLLRSEVDEASYWIY